MTSVTVSNTESELNLNPVIVLVLDRSSSMHVISEKMREAVNAFLKEQREAPADNTLFSLIVFSDEAVIKMNRIPIADAKDITADQYQCSGYTALHDAINIAIDNHADHKNALLVIVTDGEENSSKTNYKTIQDKIAAKKADGWKFIYLANDLDVSDAGDKLGFHAARHSHTSSDTNNIAVGYVNLPSVLQRSISGAVQAYRTTTEVPNLNDIGALYANAADVNNGMNFSTSLSTSTLNNTQSSSVDPLNTTPVSSSAVSSSAVSSSAVSSSAVSLATASSTISDLSLSSDINCIPLSRSYP